MNVTYCLNCGGKLSKENDTVYVCIVCKQTFYNNNAPAASVLFEKNGLFLFAKRAVEPQKGKLDYIGGFLNHAEDPKEAAIREASEETGLKINSLRIVGSMTTPYNNNFATSVVYLATEWSGTPLPTDDVEELVWLPIDTISSADFAWPNPKLLEEIKQNLAVYA